jgi:GTP cyclohydrolase I
VDEVYDASSTEPDGDDTLDYLAARLVNGNLTGTPVEQSVDLARIEKAVREILIAIGEDPDRDGLVKTPARVARAYAELFAGLRVDPAQVLGTTFEANHSELVLVRDIDVMSLCEHHLLPFRGSAHIGYIPGANGRITGLSKLARLVEVYARRPQVQERLTTQIADLLTDKLQPRGVVVVLECEHMCMAMRGIQKSGAKTITSAVRGLLQQDSKSRAEAMALIMHS